jgi:hypothetical protein
MVISRTYRNIRHHFFNLVRQNLHQDGAYHSTERQPGHEQFCSLLILTDFPQSNCTGLVTVRFFSSTDCLE